MKKQVTNPLYIKIDRRYKDNSCLNNVIMFTYIFGQIYIWPARKQPIVEMTLKNTTFHIQSKEKNKIYFIEKSIVLTGDHT